MNINLLQANVLFLSKHWQAWSFPCLGGTHEASIALKRVEIINHDFLNCHNEYLAPGVSQPAHRKLYFAHICGIREEPF